MEIQKFHGYSLAELYEDISSGDYHNGDGFTTWDDDVYKDGWKR